MMTAISTSSSTFEVETCHLAVDPDESVSFSAGANHLAILSARVRHECELLREDTPTPDLAGRNRLLCPPELRRREGPLQGSVSQGAGEEALQSSDCRRFLCQDWAGGSIRCTGAGCKMRSATPGCIPASVADLDVGIHPRPPELRSPPPNLDSAQAPTPIVKGEVFYATLRTRVAADHWVRPALADGARQRSSCAGAPAARATSTRRAATSWTCRHNRVDPRATSAAQRRVLPPRPATYDLSDAE